MKKIILIVSILLLSAGCASSATVENQPTKSVPQVNSNNSQNKIMDTTKETNTLDPKTQVLVDQFKQLTGKLSPKALKGEPNMEDQKIMEQLSQISSELLKLDTAKIAAIVSANAYGYKLSVLVNGKDIGITGGGSSGAKLFETVSIMKLISSPDLQNKSFVLNKGKNTITVKYSKTDPKSNDVLSVKIQAQGYTSPLFTLNAKDASGTVVQNIDIEPVQPADFKTVTIEK